MKFFIIQERGRHEANRNFREALCLKRGLEKIGHEVTVWGLGYDNFQTKFEEASDGHDILLSLENYDTGWHPIVSGFSGLKCFWSIDSHFALHDHISHCKKNSFDLLLNSSEQYNKFFSGLVKKAVWFPNAYPSDLVFPKENVERVHDVGFCGSLIENREFWINHISSKFKLKRDIFVIGDAMVDALSSYKISFNINVRDDINFRTFEATGSGSMLLTNYTPNLEKLFEIGKEIVVYRDLYDLLDKIEYYLKNEEGRLEIAAKGLEKSRNYHSYDQRSKMLVDIIEQA